MRLLNRCIFLMKSVAVSLAVLTFVSLLKPREAYAFDIMQNITRQIPGMEDYMVGVDSTDKARPKIVLMNKKTSKTIEYDLSQAEAKKKIEVYENGNLNGFLVFDQASKKVKYFDALGQLSYQADFPKTGCDSDVEVKDGKGKEIIAFGIKKPTVSVLGKEGQSLGVMDFQKQQFMSTEYFQKQMTLKAKGQVHDPSLDFLMNAGSVDFLWALFFIFAVIGLALSVGFGAIVTVIVSFIEAWLEIGPAIAGAVCATDDNVCRDTSHDNDPEQDKGTTTQENAETGGTCNSDTTQDTTPQWSSVLTKTGEFIEDFSLPTTSTLSPLSTLKFTYHSLWANPGTFIQTETDLDEFGACGIDKTSWKVTVMGQQKEIYYRGVSGKTFQQYYWNGKDGQGNLLPTGSYSYTIEKGNFFDNGLVAPQKMTGRVVLINTSQSPFGIGWDIEGIPHLYFSSDGTVVYVDPSGEFATYTPNQSGEFVSVSGDCCTFDKDTSTGGYIRTKKDKTQYKFNAQGELQSITDTNNNVTTFEYLNQKLRKITDPSGAQTNFTYDANGYLDYLTDFSGAVINFTINEFGQIEQVTYPDNSTVSFSNGGPTLLSKTDANGNSASFSYQSIEGVSGYSGIIQEVDYPDGSSKKFKPSVMVGLINNNPSYIGTPQNPAEPVRPEDVKAQMITPDGIRLVKLDKFGNTIEEIDLLGRKTETIRDEKGNPTKIVNPNGQVVDMMYDDKGQMLSQTDEATGATTTFVYGSPLQSVTDPSGHKTSFTYDTSENLKSITDARGNTTNFTYATGGLLSSVKDAASNTTNFTYDGSNLTQTSDPLGNATQYQYGDGRGNVTRVTDAEGISTNFGYMGTKLSDVANWLNGNTHYTYDNNGNLTSIRDARSKTTSFEYNAMNSLKKITDPLGNTQNFTTDSSGRVKQSVNARGQMITYTYDSAGRLTQKTTPDNTVFYQYDSADNLTSVKDNDSRVTFTYDLSGRVTSTTTYCEGVAKHCQPSVTLNYTYDSDGNRLSVKSTSFDSMGEETAYTYNAAHAVTSVKQTKSGVQDIFNLTYDSLGRRTQLNIKSGFLKTTYTYNKASFLTDMSTKKSDGSEMAKFNYTYDKVGNRLTMDTLDGTHSYSYDPLYRLKSASHPQEYNPTEYYSYDAVGNITCGGACTYNAANELTADPFFNYVYDADGNLTSKTEKSSGLVTQYSYDAEGQLVSMQIPDGPLIQFGYDGLGRRIWKEVGGVFAITKYVYDDEDILMEFHWNPVTSQNVYVARYVHGPGIDEPLMIYSNGRKYFYVYDGLGSVTDIVDESGNVVNHYEYDSFGNMVVRSEGVENPYTFTGREYDAEAGLYYYRARYYDASVGRFVQRDRYSLPFLTDPQESNKYSYAINNPINSLDSFGTLPGSVVKQYKDDVKKAIEDYFPSKFNNNEKERMATEMLKEAGTLEALKFKAAKNDEAKGKILQDIFERIKKKVENGGSEQDKKLLKKVKKAFEEKNKCPVKK